MRTTIKLEISDSKRFKEQLLLWATQFRECVYLDSCNSTEAYSKYDAIVAVDAFTLLQTDQYNAFDDLNQYQQRAQDWLFGFLTYDLKNDVEALTSENFDGIGFPDLFFFQPKKIFFFKDNQVEVAYLHFCDDEIKADLVEIEQIIEVDKPHQSIQMDARISQQLYVEKVGQMLEYIQKGDIYEANFCMEYFSNNTTINPVDTFRRLKAISEPPFAAFVRLDGRYLMSASPERYLQKSGSKVISQPIKGTARRSDDKATDDRIKTELHQSEKERSENIMIVDLVRNDLSKTATKGSVHVAQLCEVFSFKQVHHLISTVVSEVKSEFSAVDVIKTTFPMGSMTGAPKISAMQIIEELEESKRGLYSGAVGYFSPAGDFDFNVVIRSILYNSKNKYVSFSVGSAITAASIPENEYAECLLKAKAMLQVLQ